MTNEQARKLAEAVRDETSQIVRSHYPGILGDLMLKLNSIDLNAIIAAHAEPLAELSEDEMRLVQQLRNDGNDDAADLIERLASFCQRRQDDQPVAWGVRHENGDITGVCQDEDQARGNSKWDITGRLREKRLPVVALYAAPPLAVPECWQLVPKKPTPKMCFAGCEVSNAPTIPVEVWNAMLAAAPKP